MNIIFSDYLRHELDNLDEALKLAIDAFIFHVKKHGLKGLQGRNKSSVLPNPHTKKERANAKFAQKYCLWHYHLGVPAYVEQANGEFTSQYILHYMYYHDLIVLVDVAVHPPFELPTLDKVDMSFR